MFHTKDFKIKIQEKATDISGKASMLNQASRIYPGNVLFQRRETAINQSTVDNYRTSLNNKYQILINYFSDLAQKGNYCSTRYQDYPDHI